MSQSDFLADMALAMFDAEMEAAERKQRYYGTAAAWEIRMRRIKMQIAFLMDQVSLDRMEEAAILCRLDSMTMEEAEVIMRRLTDLLPEKTNPRDQFKARMRAARL